MANHKSAIKRTKQAAKSNLRNRAGKTRIKNVVKSVSDKMEAKDVAGAKEALLLAQSIIDKGASNGVIHKKTAARKVSRLAKKIAKLSAT
ncbi:MAG: 30S ribosomal protein S20 [Thermodesulfobacteriota bacterium]